MSQILHRMRNGLIGAAILTVCFAPGSAAAADGDLKVVLDRTPLEFPVAPRVENERTLVHAATLLRAMGGQVDWVQESQTVVATLGTHKIETKLNSDTAYVNGEAVPLDVPARADSGYVIIPLRFFVEKLGLAVTWDQANYTVMLDSTRSTVVSRDGDTVSRTGAAVAQAGLKLVGTPYAWGGTSPDVGFDCSGFVYYLGKLYGVTLPRTSYDMFELGVAVKQADLQPGDLVFYTTYAPGASHVGVYIGEGKFVHSQNESTGVIVTELSREWWASRYLGARRVFR